MTPTSHLVYIRRHGSIEPSLASLRHPAATGETAIVIDSDGRTLDPIEVDRVFIPPFESSRDIYRGLLLAGYVTGYAPLHWGRMAAFVPPES